MSNSSDLTKTDLIELVLIRHGKTAGNLRRNYIGRTDEPLCELGVAELNERIAAGMYPAVDMVFCSPMLRCRQTAALIYPGQEARVIDDLRECNFGSFENLNYQDLSGRADYQAWIDSNGEAPFPGGESREEFAERTLVGFARVADILLAVGEESGKLPGSAALVVHGGTVMAILAACTELDYFQAMCDNGCGWRVRLDMDIWREKRQLIAPEPLF